MTTLNSFTTAEKEILITEEGLGIYKHKTDQEGEFIRSGGKDFFFKDNPEKTKLYINALNLLIQKELVVWQKGDLYLLTDAGKQIVRVL